MRDLNRCKSLLTRHCLTTRVAQYCILHLREQANACMSDSHKVLRGQKYILFLHQNVTLDEKQSLRRHYSTMLAVVSSHPPKSSDHLRVPWVRWLGWNK